MTSNAKNSSKYNAVLIPNYDETRNHPHITIIKRDMRVVPQIDFPPTPKRENNQVLVALGITTVIRIDTRLETLMRILLDVQTRVMEMDIMGRM